MSDHAAQQRSMASMKAVEHAHGEHHIVVEWPVGQRLPVGDGHARNSVIGAAPRCSRMRRSMIRPVGQNAAIAVPMDRSVAARSVSGRQAFPWFENSE